MKSIAILGSTGSIGENALRVVDTLPGRFAVTALAASTNAERIVQQAVRYNVPRIALADKSAAAKARSIVPEGIEVLEGEEGVCALAQAPENELVVCAIVGMAALGSVFTAIQAGHDVAIATKEVLVAAGKLVTGLCRENKVNLLPIDSEHSALFQALQDTGAVPRCVSYRFPEKADTSKLKNIRQLILTASGGPFASRKDVDFDNITVGEALNHPRWAMGPKVTIDSATMMNKGLEILEAKWLFDIPAENISVLVHPESIVHSLVEFADGAQMAQLGYPDMRLPIQYAMTWPERVANDTLPRLDLALASTLNFSNPDYERFPCLRLAENAAGAGGLVPTAMNAANEMAVESFLEGKIKFSRIWEIVERVMWEFETEPEASTDELDKIIDADARARISAGNLINAR